MSWKQQLSYEVDGQPALNSQENRCTSDGLQGDRRWYAAYTASRHEKRVAEYCMQASIEHFLPLFTQRKKWKNRMNASVELPLFPNYIFVSLSDKEHGRLLRLPGVLSTVGSAAGPAPIPDWEIDKLRRVISCRNIEPHPYPQEGGRVRICAGPLEGLTGVVQRKTNGMRLVVTIDSIQKSVAVEISAEELEPLLNLSSVGTPSGNRVAVA